MCDLICRAVFRVDKETSKEKIWSYLNQMVKQKKELERIHTDTQRPFILTNKKNKPMSYKGPNEQFFSFFMWFVLLWPFVFVNTEV